MPAKKSKVRRSPTITFQPDDDVRDVLAEEIQGKPRAYQSKIINESLRIALATARKADEAAEKARREVISQTAAARHR